MAVALRAIKPVCNLSLADEVEKLRVIDREIKKLTKVYDSLKKEIVDTLISTNQKEVVNASGHVIATYSERKGRASFDKDKFNIDYPGVYQSYEIIGAPSFAFNFKS
jgi:hypothetical protein